MTMKKIKPSTNPVVEDQKKLIIKMDKLIGQLTDQRDGFAMRIDNQEVLLTAQHKRILHLQEQLMIAKAKVEAYREVTETVIKSNHAIHEQVTVGAMSKETLHEPSMSNSMLFSERMGIKKKQSDSETLDLADEHMKDPSN